LMYIIMHGIRATNSSCVNKGKKKATFNAKIVHLAVIESDLIPAVPYLIYNPNHSNLNKLDLSTPFQVKDCPSIIQGMNKNWNP
ncbi:hypothetical protein VIGAN_09136500, partial [Vigna angularis var. angularis]